MREAITNSKIQLDLRYRLEGVDDDTPRFDGRDALASTLRTQLGLTTGDWHGLQARLAFENVAVVGNEDLYNNAGSGSLHNGVTDRPVVADPEITEILDARLIWKKNNTEISVGRTPLAYDDHRFLGTVAWRQHFQTVDTARIGFSLASDWQIEYAYLDRVHRITGQRRDLDSHVLHGTGSLGPGTLTLFAYLLDYEQDAARGLDSETWGARYHGETAHGVGRWIWDLQFAHQTDDDELARDLAELDADFVMAVVGWGQANWSVRAGYELLGGDGSRSFQTPLATLHKFNGWADRFLTTPAGGLEDLYLRWDQDFTTWSYTVRWHRFTADTSTALLEDYGSELDFEVKRQWQHGPTTALRFARYEADDFSPDTTKAMLYATWKFDLH